MRKVKNMDRKVFLERCIDIFADYIAELNEISGYVITQEEQESFRRSLKCRNCPQPLKSSSLRRCPHSEGPALPRLDSMQ